MILDRLVVYRHQGQIELLSERLQTKADLNLEKAKKLIQQSEAVQQQEGILKSSNKMLESVAKSKANSRFTKTHKRLVPLPKAVQKKQIPREPCNKCKTVQTMQESFTPQTIMSN